MKRSKALVMVVVLFLALISTFNILESLSHILTLKTNYSQTDFHSYWYSGQFVRQGMDPYKAYLEGGTLKYPVDFVDGSISTRDEITQRAKNLAIIPANTAPMVLLLTFFSSLPWHIAGSIWIVSNVIMAILIPWLMWSFIKPSMLKIPRIGYMLLFLVYMSLNLTARGIIGNGQTTFLVMFLMFTALILMDSQRDILAGIVLGIALSKYSVALPVLLLVLFRRNFKVALVSIAVQLLGVVFLAAITQSSPLTIIESYLTLAKMHSTGEVTVFRGIHIGGYLPQTMLSNVISFVIITVPIGIVLLRSVSWQLMPQVFSMTSARTRLFELNFLAVLMMWLLLAVYHLGYDIVMAIAPFALLITVCFSGREWGLSKKQSLILTGSGLTILVFLILPGSVFRSIFQLPFIYNWVLTLSSISLLGLSVWLLQQLTLFKPANANDNNKMP